MQNRTFKTKRREWLRRYIPAEIIGTIAALSGAWMVYAHTHSFIAATAVGWTAEGIGFYGYFVITELRHSTRRYAHVGVRKRLLLAAAAASTNLVVEFLPAEILDSLILRPYLMYLMPHYIHPYPLGFLAGKFGADILFYVLAIIGYEARSHWFHR